MARPRAPAPRNGRSLVIAAAVCFAAALALLGAHAYAFEAVVAAAARVLSTDGIVEATNRRTLSAVLLGGAAFAALAGMLSLALSVPAWRVVMNAVVTFDPLRRLGLEVSNAHLVQASSVTIGTLVVGMHLVGSRLGGFLGPMFRKEGPFELLTVALELLAAVWCVGAARHWNKHGKRTSRAVPVLYATLGIVLFLVAMEELNWGQTLLGFDTPSTWAAINYQQETSLHNLWDRPTLIVAERLFMVLFGISVVALMAFAKKFPRSAFAAIAPPGSLLGLAMICAIPGAFIRLEVSELLLAIFFAFYSYRNYIAARSRVVTLEQSTAH